MALQTWLRRSATLRGALPLHDFACRREAARRLPWQTQLIREDDVQDQESFFLLYKFQSLFNSPNISEGKLTRLNQMRHYRSSRAAKQIQEVGNQSPVNSLPGEHRFKNVRVANFFHPPNRTLLFKAVNHGLDGRIGRPVLFGQVLLNFADR